MNELAADKFLCSEVFLNDPEDYEDYSNEESQKD
jgi:hypothetical protein